MGRSKNDEMNGKPAWDRAQKAASRKLGALCRIDCWPFRQIVGVMKRGVSRYGTRRGGERKGW